MGGRVREVFEAVLEIPAADRRRWLDVTPMDEDTRREVSLLLEASDELGGFLAAPTDGGARFGTAPEADHQVGPYHLIELIGEGGFGAVYRAEQHEPVARQVALKIIRLGMDTRRVVARFRTERRALECMDHPNIARVLDAGMTGSGRPYFVMELVRGEPVTRYCKERGLGLRTRLELFLQVCAAVQHAHQKGIIHRDLKPSNVLVAEVDGVPVPKVIDFGIARAIQRGPGPETLTGLGQLVGTPEYMSPEQAGAGGADVDTRSDVYALGVILYQLLTGTLPFDPRALRESDHAGLLRIIREVEPPKPSTRLAMLRSEPVHQNAPATPLEVAARRDADFASLQRRLRGELDWIVMKCIEKDRERRYDTASALALDVERYLRHEPVMAGPPSRVYRFRKFARRHRTMVWASALVAVALLVGLAGMTFGLVRAEERRIQAEAAKEREREQRELAEKREEETRQVSEFQAAMLSGIDAEEMGRGIRERFREQVRGALERQYVGEFPDRRPRTPHEVEAELVAFDQIAGLVQAPDVARGVMDGFVLAPAAETLEERFADQPLVRAQLERAIGIAYKELGLYSAAEPHLRTALEIARPELGDDHLQTQVSMAALAELLKLQGDWAEAERYQREALDICRRLLGDEHPDTLVAIYNRGMVLMDQGKLAEAEPYFREALEGGRRVLGDEHPHTLKSIGIMGQLRLRQLRTAEAEPFLTESLRDFRRVLGDEHPYTLDAITSMGQFLWDEQRPADAEPFYREVWESRRRRLGDEHPETLDAMTDVGRALQWQGKLADAEPYYRQALEGRRRVLGDEHRETLDAMDTLGRLLQAQGELDEAASRLREAMEQSRRVLDDEDPLTPKFEHHYADVLREAGRLDEAIALAQTAVNRYRAHPDRHRNEATHASRVLGASLRAAGRHAEAVPLVWEWLEENRRDPATTPVRLAGSLAHFATEAITAGVSLDRAEEALRECLEIHEKVPESDPEYGQLANALSLLGGALATHGASLIESDAPGAIARFTEAEPLLIEAARWLSRNADRIPAEYRAQRVRAALARVIRLYESWDTVAPGSGKAEQAAQWRAQLEP